MTITEPKGSFALPADAAWLMLVGDLTAMPAMARIAETAVLPTRIWAEVPDDLPGYLPDGADVTWLEAAVDGASRLAEVVECHRLAGRRRATSGWRASPRRCARSAST